MNCAIVFFGTRGGGPRQLLNLVETLEGRSEKIYLYTSGRNELLIEIADKSKSLLTICDLPASKFGILTNYFQKVKVLKNVYLDLEAKNVQRVYFLLPHPWDLNLSKRIVKSNKMEIWRGIHDVKNHPGEAWPRAQSIKKLIKYSTKLVVHSRFIEDRLVPYGKPIIISSIYEVRRSKKDVFVPGSVLFIGRIKKYKGIKLLLKAWPQVTSQNKSLTIAGLGRLPGEVRDFPFTVHNRWLSNIEIESLIQRASVVVLPYIEASQSGVISIAHSLCTPVVVTPVGGLTDQIIVSKNGIVADDLSPEALAKAIDLALNMSWDFGTIPNPLHQFLDRFTAP
jgi:glycosyltransferase involved in cell wall biosynthesis